MVRVVARVVLRVAAVFDKWTRSTMDATLEAARMRAPRCRPPMKHRR
jgi:hypothetical protein